VASLSSFCRDLADSSVISDRVGRRHAVHDDGQVGGNCLPRFGSLSMKDDQAAQAIAAIPGVGVLTATAAVATMGQANAFKSGREFAAWLGLVPGQTGSGGTIKLQGISKRGDTYLRTLLVHGARSIIYRVKQPGPWVEQMKQRRPLNVVIVAMANKLARIIWAMLAHQQPYRQDYARSKSA
jgi:transposase